MAHLPENVLTSLLRENAHRVKESVRSSVFADVVAMPTTYELEEMRRCLDLHTLDRVFVDSNLFGSDDDDSDDGFEELPPVQTAIPKNVDLFGSDDSDDAEQFPPPQSTIPRKKLLHRMGAKGAVLPTSGGKPVFNPYGRRLGKLRATTKRPDRFVP